MSVRTARVPYELDVTARAHRPAQPVRVRPGDPYPAGGMVPVEAARTGDTQVLAARYPGRIADPVVDLDRLAELPSVDSLIASTDVRAGRPLPYLRELLLTEGAPVPPAPTLGHLVHLERLYAPLAPANRKLAIEALPAASLVELTAHRACLRDLDAIAALTGLRALEVRDLLPGDSVAAVGHLTELVELRIGGPRVKGWRSLARCHHLEQARLNGLTAPDLRAFASWTALRSLTVTRKGLRSLDGIDALRSLTALELLVSSITDLSPLAGAPNLRSLRLVGMSDLHDIGPLAALPHLRTLEISRAGVEDSDIIRLDSLRPLAGLTELSEIRLDGTVVADGDLSPLTSLAELRRLHLFAVSGPVVDELGRQPHLDLTISPGPQARPDVSHGIAIRPAPGEGDQWLLREDLASRFGLDTNFDAEEAVLDAIRAEEPDLVPRLHTDTESAAVEISAADPADLRAVAAIIARMTRTLRG